MSLISGDVKIEFPPYFASKERGFYVSNYAVIFAFVSLRNIKSCFSESESLTDSMEKSRGLFRVAPETYIRELLSGCFEMFSKVRHYKCKHASLLKTKRALWYP